MTCKHSNLKTEVLHRPQDSNHTILYSKITITCVDCLAQIPIKAAQVVKGSIECLIIVHDDVQNLARAARELKLAPPPEPLPDTITCPACGVSGPLEKDPRDYKVSICGQCAEVLHFHDGHYIIAPQELIDSLSPEEVERVATAIKKILHAPGNEHEAQSPDPLH